LEANPLIRRGCTCTNEACVLQEALDRHLASFTPRESSILKVFIHYIVAVGGRISGAARLIERPKFHFAPITGIPADEIYSVWKNVRRQAPRLLKLDQATEILRPEHLIHHRP